MRIGQTTIAFCDPGVSGLGVTLAPGELGIAPKFSEQQQRILRALCRPLMGDGEGLKPGDRRRDREGDRDRRGDRHDRARSPRPLVRPAARCRSPSSGPRSRCSRCAPASSRPTTAPSAGERQPGAATATPPGRGSRRSVAVGVALRHQRRPPVAAAVAVGVDVVRSGAAGLEPRDQLVEPELLEALRRPRRARPRRTRPAGGPPGRARASRAGRPRRSRGGG